MPPSHLLIVGASARAAAFSALRTGLQPWCADLFADADLQARCHVLQVRGAEYPLRFLELLEQAPTGPLMYTGGLENRPGLIAKMEQRRNLWGNGEKSLAHARAPLAVADILRRSGLPCPDVLPPSEWPIAAGQWLVKPTQSAGGQGISVWDGCAIRRRRVYLQQYVSGDSYAACYNGDGNATRFLGVTRQLVGEEWLHAAPFHYCGSIGPFALDVSARQQLERLGLALAEGCQLRGLFGVDLVLNDATYWPVEINPRYTASVEVLEYATGASAIALHRRVFDNQTRQTGRAGSVSDRSERQSSGRSRSRLANVVGKAILFASNDLTFPGTGPWSSLLTAPGPVTDMPAFADVPFPGHVIKTGQPVLTFFARADSPLACLDALREIAADLDRRLFGR